MAIAPRFILTDYDSPDAVVASTTLEVNLRLTNAIDIDSEGVNVELSGTVALMDLGVTDSYTREYVLRDGTSYSQYEEVCSFHTHYCCVMTPLSISCCVMTPLSITGPAFTDLLQL